MWLANNLLFSRCVDASCDCQDDVDTESVTTDVSCIATYAPTEDRFNALSMDLQCIGQYHYPEPDGGYAKAPKTSLNWIKLKVQNSGTTALTVDRDCKHVFRCSGERPNQRRPMTIQPGENEFDILVRYTEAEVGREFMMNTSRIELDCGSKSIAKSIAWTRHRDASDPGPTTCEPAGST